ncbi:MAG TPA: hypothetical protein VMV04_15525 [Thermodesulfobacteriota bacterium]|nr:hypothetical protein [Thermodesulfobacteriota bacterium]
MAHGMEMKILLRRGDLVFPLDQENRIRGPATGVQLRSAWILHACMLIGISLFTAILATPMPLKAEPVKGLGMWVWSHSAYATPETRQQLVDFCVKHRIRHLDVHVRMSRNDGEPILQDAGALRDLILLAGQYHITTAALRGHPKMFFSKNHERSLRELRAIIDFSKTLPGDAPFKGIKYDVEPYCAKDWKAEGTTLEGAMQDYLAFLRKARSVLHNEAPRLWLAVDTPFWWDKDEFVMDFEGERKRYNEHVQDLTDFIVIMSYRRSVGEVLNSVENERKYAKRIRKFIYASLETIQLKQDPHVSFWGVSNEEFWKVVPQLLEAAEGDPAIGGVMIHCYRGLVEKFSNLTPSEPMKTAPE